MAVADGGDAGVAVAGAAVVGADVAGAAVAEPPVAGAAVGGPADGVPGTSPTLGGVTDAGGREKGPEGAWVTPAPGRIAEDLT
jgi:hypothetical protein